MNDDLFTLPATITKQPSEAINVSISFARRLPVDVTLASASIQVLDQITREDVSTELALSTVGTISGDVATFRIRAGTNGKDYSLRTSGTLSDGQIHTLITRLKIRDEFPDRR